tara:strand:+ start:951 stop:3149 length:2199 start_codon:yes stop_codon:yes gene_type:complete
MYKILIRTVIFFTIILIFSISYLSVFGIKTNKFNEIIKSQLIKQDNRLDIDLKDVFIKLNIKEKSFSLSSQNVKFFIIQESQKISNIDLLISLRSLITKDKKIKKIIVNSEKNEIKNLLKFIRAYKLNIPALYLENSIEKGTIIYDLIIDFKDNNLHQIQLSGKIINAEFVFLGKEIIENVNLNFNYNNKNLEIINLKLKYKNTIFVSENITANLKNNSLSLKGDFKNKIYQNLISTFLNYDVKNYLNDKFLLSSKSNFEINFTKKFKIKNYNLKSKIYIDDIKINLKNIKLKKYLTDFKDKIILKKGEINLNINHQNKTDIKIKSKYILNENQKLRDISLNYSKFNSFEKFEFYIDLIENEMIFDEINFNKKKDEEMFLNLIATKNIDIYEIINFKLFNAKNILSLKNIKFGKNFKITDFSKIEANYYNKDDFLNNIFVTKKNNKINLISKNFDISNNIEKTLKGTTNVNFLDIFQNLNSSINIDIKLAKLDSDHNLKKLNGKVVIKNNKVESANLSAKFNEKNNFIYTKDELNGKKVTTIFSDIAKPFVKKFKFIKGFEDGKLDFTSTEIDENLLKSELRIYDFKVKDMPVLTKLLSLASLQGIADLATGEGIRFNEFDMFFENSKNLIKINEIYALGPAISILMEGYVEKNKLVSLRGTMVPATTINKTIAKIPLLGEILVGEKTGEGVFGVSFKIKGPPGDLETRVNPIKTLTPRFITRTLDKIKKSN